MLRILLADDDILALNRITGMLYWNTHGYEIAGQAMNGKDCLKLTASLTPDILILDIDMPDKNGVDVIRELAKSDRMPPKILILSNYDTFAFVRDAMRYGACDYLLKHELNEDMLLAKLQEAEHLMRKEGLSTSHMSYFTTVAKQNYLRGLVLSGITNEEEHRHILTQKDFDASNYVLAVMQITNFILITLFSPGMTRERMVESIRTLGTNIFSSLDNGLITYTDYGQFVILFHYQGETGSQDILNHAVSNMRLLSSNIQKLFNLTSIWQTSGIFTGPDRIRVQYQQVTALLEHKKIVPSSESNNAPPASNSIDLQEEKELMNALTALDLSESDRILRRLLDRYVSGSGQISQQIILQLLQTGTRFCQNQKLEFSEKYTGADTVRLNQMTSPEIYSFLLVYFHRILAAALGNNHRSISPMIREAILYIRENYSRDISLAVLAERLRISHSHLSRQFSRETGTSFVDYVVSYRIERAGELLRNTDLGLKDIAVQTRFNSYNYFLRVYKEKTGHTPTQDLRH